MAKNHKKQIAEYQQNPWVLLAMGFVFAGIAYGLGSWAIDSGAIPLYLATFASAYMAVSCIVRCAKNIIRN